MKNNLFPLTLTLILFCSLTANLSAQVWEDIGFKQGDVELSAGIGLLPTFVGKNTEASIPPLSFALSYRVKKTFTVGAYLGYSQTQYVAPDDLDNDVIAPELTNNYYLTGLRAEGHFSRDRFDFYGGGMIGYNFSFIETKNLPGGRLENIEVAEYADKVTWSGHIGAKYLLTSNIGLYGEVGYGVSIVNLGITTRF